MSTLTIYLARLIGLSALVLVAAFLVRGADDGYGCRWPSYARLCHI
jgi:hypothetical protein